MIQETTDVSHTYTSAGNVLITKSRHRKQTLQILITKKSNRMTVFCTIKGNPLLFQKKGNTFAEKFSDLLRTLAI